MGLALLDGELRAGPRDAATTFDNLLADGLVRPFVAVMPGSGWPGQSLWSAAGCHRSSRRLATLMILKTYSSSSTPTNTSS